MHQIVISWATEKKDESGSTRTASFSRCIDFENDKYAQAVYSIFDSEEYMDGELGIGQQELVRINKKEIDLFIESTIAEIQREYECDSLKAAELAVKGMNGGVNNGIVDHPFFKVYSALVSAKVYMQAFSVEEVELFFG